MENLKDILVQIELHSVEGIKRNFSEGINPNVLFRKKPLINELTSEYTRSQNFKECVKAFVEFGLEFEDEPLLSVLLDDSDSLSKLIENNPEFINSKYTLRCAYTQMIDVSLLHIYAEFNHQNCAQVLIENGANVNVKAGIDKYGFGGQTPIFHTVNQNNNQSAGMMDFLLSNSSDLSITTKGLIWGKGYEWETLIPSVNPISYAMMGLLPQMHRNEQTIAIIVSVLLNHRYGIDYKLQNIPNKYLKSDNRTT